MIRLYLEKGNLSFVELEGKVVFRDDGKFNGILNFT